jgi:hypothetical protein
MIYKMALVRILSTQEKWCFLEFCHDRTRRVDVVSANGHCMERCGAAAPNGSRVS